MAKAPSCRLTCPRCQPSVCRIFKFSVISGCGGVHLKVPPEQSSSSSSTWGSSRPRAFAIPRAAELAANANMPTKTLWFYNNIIVTSCAGSLMFIQMPLSAFTSTWEHVYWSLISMCELAILKQLSWLRQGAIQCLEVDGEWKLISKHYQHTSWDY